MEEPSRKEKLQIIGIVGGFLIFAVSAATLMAFSDLRSRQEKTSVEVGNYVSTTLSGSEGSTGLGVGVGMNGQAMVGAVSTGSDLISLVQTNTQTLAVKGAFTDRIGDALFVVTMQDNGRFLCPSSKTNCRSIVDQGK